MSSGEETHVLDEVLRPRLEALARTHLFRHLRSVSGPQGAWVGLDGKHVLSLSSNNYLGLADDPVVKQAAVHAVECYGCGAGASRLVSGGMELHEALEHELAAFKHTEAALLFSTGYHANIGVIPAVVDGRAAIFSDERNHASIIDGCRLSRATVHVFRHRDMAHLEELLARAAGASQRLIITESVFSMDGDVAPLDQIVDVARMHRACVMVDEAHATGGLWLAWRRGRRTDGSRRAGRDPDGHLEQGAREPWGLCGDHPGSHQLAGQSCPKLYLHDGVASTSTGIGPSRACHRRERAGAPGTAVGECGPSERGAQAARLPCGPARITDHPRLDRGCGADDVTRCRAPRARSLCPRHTAAHRATRNGQTSRDADGNAYGGGSGTRTPGLWKRGKGRGGSLVWSNTSLSAYQKLKGLDHQHLWHPFTQMRQWLADDPLIISRGEGNYLIDFQGNRYLDGASSLWCNVHGHNRSEINAAIVSQLADIAHTTLLGLSNVPAIVLAEKLIASAPPGLTRVFYSDDGATAVEAALKMAVQYWQLKGRTRKTKFASLIDAYHGDTLGAVSVGYSDLFHHFYRPLLPACVRLTPPHLLRWREGLTETEASTRAVGEARRALSEHGDEIAALIIEPLMQGAAGMWPQPAGYLQALREMTREHEILLICDEVATGFGRTERCSRVSTTP